MSVGPTLKSIFGRVDTNKDNSLDRAEVKKFVEDAGVGSGFFAGKKVNGATDAFVDQFDGDKDGKVGWDEFRSKGRSLIPGAAQNATPAEVKAAAGGLVDRADGNKDGAVTVGELARTIEPELEARNVDMAGTKAEIGAKLGVRMLDHNGDGKISRAEVDSLADDVAKELAALRNPR